ncbi:hypothetical protein PTSG_05755 [Salpingoeca rosetta]|uniref:Opine dehydrogenase domain-containing protein n=1 Tax=Salpingoeca rosetta (strain ATCC 50818 / BSB-021) TaxID=946362 RepID=F2UB50_SALR5|nr:uncharacterized protein PTSG_05755 [Salpingoeca rosetta]EGD74063.1 hypothetical protein PTSG_05755 [Salpingoeca rosetta]|eukprot:XP_004993625.1 hypothetical protein PTSG_05755 [Salpingoeca rosetta]
MAEEQRRPVVTVCGGGNAAHVAVGMFTTQGADVNLFFSFEEEARKFRKGCERTGGVTVNTKDGSYKAMPKAISNDPAEVIPDSDLILLITPAFAHEPILKEIAPHLHDGAFVGAIPGPGGFNMLAKHVLGDLMQKKNVTLFGAGALPWVCRFTEYGSSVDLQSEKANIFVSYEPHTEKTWKRLGPLLNQLHKNTTFLSDGHFLTITMWCTNAVIHPAITYGIWRDWDGKPVAEQPLFYQNCDEFTGNVLQTISDEVKACRDVIVSRTDADLSQWQPIDEYTIDAYGDNVKDRSSTARIFASNFAYRGLKAPCKQLDDGTFMPNFHTRYLTDDLPHGLCVMRGIADICGVKTPMMDKVILWAQEKIGHEYIVDGKLQGKDVAHSGCPQRFGIKTVEELVAF